MRMSSFFLPTLKDAPAEATTASHRLMLRAGMIQQQSAGVYSWLPLGHKALKRIEHIVHDEQMRAGHNPVLMPILQSADLWKESGRYDAYGDEMLRVRDRNQREMVFGPTNEEMITHIFRSHVTSYKALPLTLYQIQWKFRDEMRPRYGVIRGREFLMKDGYSFDLTREDALHAYNRHLVSYLRTYERMGLKAIPMRADAGAIGGEHTHEFLVLADTGESLVHYDAAVLDQTLGHATVDMSDKTECAAIVDRFTSLYARTEETHDAAIFANVPKERQRSARGIEVGQIFYFGTKYSATMGATVAGPDGNKIPVEMGSYGIGVSRVLGAIVEANHDERGIVWPEGSTPYHVAIVNTAQGNIDTDATCAKLYHALTSHKLEPLYDDRNERAGVKFATMDLIGIPWRITVGPRGLLHSTVDVTCRRTGANRTMSFDDAVMAMRAVYAPHL